MKLIIAALLITFATAVSAQSFWISLPPWFAQPALSLPWFR